MVNLNTLEAKKKKAEEEKEGNIVEAQINVYEGQTYEARDAYAEAKAKRGKARAKLPEVIPDDKLFEENLLQAQYAKGEAKTQSQADNVDEYTAEIKVQQKAKETTRILDEQMPALLYKAEQEVESVKEEVYVTAKKTATANQDALVQSLATQIESEKQRRIDERDAINTKYSSQKNPYPYRAGSAGKSYDNRSWSAWNRQHNISQTNELNALNARNISADGFVTASIRRGGRQPMPSHPTSRKLWTGEAINQVSARALQNNTPLSQISNRTTRYEVAISRANRDALDGGSLTAHASAVQSAKNVFDGMERKEDLKFSAQARVDSKQQLRDDKEKWDNIVETNWSVVTAKQKKLDSKGLNINVAELDKAGLSTLYNVGELGDTVISNAGDKRLTTVDMMKAGFLPNQSTVGVSSTATGFARRADSPVNGMTLDTSPKLSSNVVGLKLDSQPVITGSYNSNPLLNGTYTSNQIDSKDYKSQVNAYADNVYKQQRVTELANQRQTAYTNELVAGRVGIATALLNPQTTQTYTGKNTRNLKTYLSERGFDISNPDTIPDSVFYPTKGVSGKVDSKGMFVIPSQPVISSDVLRERTEARARWESITVPTMPNNTLLAPPAKQKQAKAQTQADILSGSSLISAKVKPPTWTFNNQSFTSKDKLDAYVKTRTDQAVANTKANQLLNKKKEFTWGDKKINKVGTLNSEAGYIEGFVSPVNDPFKHSPSDVKGTKYGGESLTDAVDAKRSENDSMLNEAKYGHVNAKFNYMKNVTGSLNPDGYIKGFVAPTTYTRYDDPAPTPQWTVGGITFTSKDELTDYIRTGKDTTFKEAKDNTKANQLLNDESNISGSLSYTNSILGLKSSTSNTVAESSNTNPTVPQWNVDGLTFTSKTEFANYVKSKSDSVLNQAKDNTKANQLLNETSNITGSLDSTNSILGLKPATSNTVGASSNTNPTVPQWSADGITFTSKSEFKNYIKSGKDEILKQAQGTSDENKFLNKEKNEFTWGDKNTNVSGTLNPDGYTKPTTTVLDVPSNTSGTTTVPAFTYNDKTFESKDELDTFVKSSSDAKLEQAKGGITNPINSLLADGYTTKVKDSLITPTGDSRYANTGYKPEVKPVTDASKSITSYNSNPVLNKGGTVSDTLVKNDGLPTTYTGNIFAVTDKVSGVTKEFRKKEVAQKYADRLNSDQNMKLPQFKYVVQFGQESTTVTDMQGNITKVQAPVSHVFDTEEQAQSFSRAVGSVMKQPTADDYMFGNYATSVDRGLIPPPKNLIEQGLYHTSGIVGVPIGNLRKTIGGLVDPEQKYYKDAPTGGMEPTFLEHSLGGTVDDVMKGTPFKFTGVTSGANYFMADPMRTVKQVPAMYVEFASGNAFIKPVTSVAGNVIKQGVKAGTNAGFRVIQSGVPMIIKVPVMVGMGVASSAKAGVTVIATGVARGVAVPKKVAYQMGTRVGVKVDKTLQTANEKVIAYAITHPSQAVKIPVRLAVDFKSNLFKIDKKLNVIDGARTGLKLKAELLYTTKGQELRGRTLEEGKLIALKSSGFDDYIRKNPSQFGDENYLLKKYQQSVDYTYYDKQTSSIYSTNDGKISGMVLDMGNTVKTKPHLTTPEKYYQALDDLTKQKSDDFSAWRSTGQQLPTEKMRNTYFSQSSAYFKKSEAKYILKRSYIETKFGKKTGGGKTVRQPLQILYTDNVGNLAQSDSVLIQTTKLPKGITGQKKVNELMFEVPMTKSNRGIVETMLREDKLQPVGQESKALLPNKEQGVSKTFDLQDSASAQLGKNEVDFTTSRTTIYQGDMSPIIKTKVEKIRPDFVKPKDNPTKSQMLETVINTGSFKQYPPNVLDPLKKIYHKNKTNDITKSESRGFDKTQSSRSYGSQQIFDTTDEIIVPSGTGKVKDFIGGRGDDIAKRNKPPVIKQPPTSKSAIIGSAIISTGTKVVSGLESRIDTGVKIQQGVKLNAILSPKQVIAQRVKSRTQQKGRTKLDTGLKVTPKLKQAQALAYQIPIKTIQVRHRPTIIPVVIPRGQGDGITTRKSKRGNKAGFIGNVRLDNIMGMYKRKEITYGQSKVNKLERQDARLTSGTPNRISMPASSLLTKKKKKKKGGTETIFGRTVTKTKDEFSGFSKSIEKTKSVKKKKVKGKKKKQIRKSTTKRFL